MDPVEALDRIAFLHDCLDFGRFLVQMQKDGFRHVQPADDQIFLCQKFPLPARVRRHASLRRNIAAPQILAQKLGDARQNKAVLEKIHKKLN